jgi:hypothetical protein
MRHSRSFIAPEVNLSFLPVYEPIRFTDLLMAQGIISQHDVAARASGGSEVNGRKRPREDDIPGPSKRHTTPTIKKEEISATARAQRIRDLQVSINSISFNHT